MNALSDQNKHKHVDPGSTGCSVEAEPVWQGSSLAGIVPDKLLDEGETVILAIKPSLWFLAFGSAKTIGLLILVLLFAPYLADKLHPLGLSITVIVQFAGALMVLRLLMAVLEWFSRLYVLTDRRVMRIKGVFNIDVFECPLTQIQNTYLTLALHERVFKLGSIQFATAGTGIPEAVWQNINEPLTVHETIRQAIWRARKGREVPFL